MSSRGFAPRRPEWALLQSSTGVRTAGDGVSPVIRAGHIEVSEIHPVAPSGPLAEASIAHPPGLLVRLLRAGKVLLAGSEMGVSPEVSTAVAASGAFTEEAIGKLRERGREKDPCGPSFLSEFCYNPGLHTSEV